MSINPLTPLSLLRFSGAKAQAFLQGQLTCDMRLLSEHAHYSFAACCDHRGRMIANFWVVNWHHDFLFILPTEMIKIVHDHLQKYAVFSKVVISEEKDLFIAETDGTCENTENKVCVTLPNRNRHLILMPASDTVAIANNDAWKKQNIEDGLCILSEKTSLLFTPQMINLEKQGGVSFDKGCYVGQEIVARTEHLGTLKRHLHRLQLQSDHPLNPGDELKNKHNETIGVIADSVETDKNHYDLLAVIEDRYNTTING